ncbi:MAG: hypothetical protein A2932_00520 [Candidatus Spechtbacteria bacterium RIFCSPLOWO2_01_FULL_46_10]|uniref:TraC-like domain-containing protein n=1 Tax=Candidatus Spechtbacteria bacterium RIFCSPLOWO2_01_FULL_46_10 TaxID=1802163 RepID=A0A1G2HI91_9BACT|nr:MAG: hypothetical protein A2932_00520 [Candidatus Spechtbacteria bacterium RIFCSPLOWO2_01_FULL_46_10]
MPAPSTHKFVRVENIRDDVVILRDGSLRAVLLVSSMNFALKSRQEQEAIVFEYQNFLNSLDFPVQILVNSRLVNIDAYIQNLEKKARQHENELLKLQTQEYVKFIHGFVAEANIISTDFYVVVPFSLVESSLSQGGAGERIRTLFGLGGKAATARRERFVKYEAQLMQRVDFVSGGLHRLGVTARMLSTEELISLYWNMYNPGDLRKRHLVKSIFES